MTPLAIWFYLAVYSAAFPQLTGPYTDAHCAAMKQIGEANMGPSRVTYRCLPMTVPEEGR